MLGILWARKEYTRSPATLASQNSQSSPEILGVTLNHRTPANFGGPTGKNTENKIKDSKNNRIRDLQIVLAL